MRIGITGASGLIGGKVAQLASASGHQVIAYSRQDRAVAGAAECIELPAQGLARLPETRLDALVHLAGESLMGLWTPAKKKRIWESRVDLTRAMVAHVASWQPANRPKILLGASGAGYYGDRGDTELDESASQGSGFLADLCGHWEEAAARAQQWQARVVHLRTSVVLSRDGGAYAAMRRAFLLGLGGHFGSGRQWMPWIHLDDAAGLMLMALENSAVQGPLNIASPAPELNRNFTAKLARALHRPAFLHVPAWALRLAMPGMAQEMLLASQRQIPSAAQACGYRFAYPVLEDALAELR